MNGILSAAPGQGTIRLLVGSHGLLLTQSALTAWSGLVDGALRTLSLLIVGIATAALVGAIIGEGHADHDRSWRPRHGR